MWEQVSQESELESLRVELAWVECSKSVVFSGDATRPLEGRRPPSRPEYRHGLRESRVPTSCRRSLGEFLRAGGQRISTFGLLDPFL